MFAVLSAIARLIGIGGVLFIGLLIYEEGVPGANRIPFLTSIPVIGDLTAGRVHTYAAQQVKLATSNMVTKFERDAIASQLATERLLLSQANRAAADDRARATEALKQKTQAEAALEARIAADTGPDGGRWSEEDDRWNIAR
ncbi:hypothetical protein G9X67_34495 [Rhizobium sp. WYCCWR 11152]|uniref:hypothetical protein n=1 Tax=Rhizobium sp. WYCCWR 11152 TaxID=2692316 RepID=UPI0014917496|nr:hypothetical protein [Rhizobium sp. WYCCWR 11152]NNU70367.1 hypothetical protein [Rhizobium sp. WYCCWR 11152]